MSTYSLRTSGLWHDRRGFDTIVQTVSGMALASGDGTRQKYLPVSAIDYVSGYLMPLGAMAALARRVALRRAEAGWCASHWRRLDAGSRYWAESTQRLCSTFKRTLPRRRERG